MPRGGKRQGSGRKADPNKQPKKQLYFTVDEKDYTFFKPLFRVEARKLYNNFKKTINDTHPPTKKA
jgi:hypothetical protein